MSDTDRIFDKIDHLTGKLQEKILRTRSTNPNKPNLHWGQFIVDPRDDAQVGVYGSACSAIISAARDDDQARAARDELRAYVESAPEAEGELAHNIKMAMVVLALAPCPGADAHPTMLDRLGELLNRRSVASKLWPAYTRPASQAGARFAERDSEVATSIILVLLDAVHRCLCSPRYASERGQIETLSNETAARLEQACASRRIFENRFSALIASAVILIKGRQAGSAVRQAYREAVRTHDFAERRVLFYDCLRNDTFTRDYFIVPMSVVLPIVAYKAELKPTDRALAFVVAQRLVEELDDDGIFRTGQELSSTVEQALAYLSLQSALRGRNLISRGQDQVALSWLQLTQSSATGVPTKLVGTAVIGLWLFAAVAVVGKFMPAQLRSTAVLQQIYEFAAVVPEPLTTFLGFVAGALPVSQALFLRLIRRIR